MSVDIIGLHFKIADFLSDGTTKSKLAKLAFLFCGEFEKTLLLTFKQRLVLKVLNTVEE